MGTPKKLGMEKGWDLGLKFRLNFRVWSREHGESAWHPSTRPWRDAGSARGTVGEKGCAARDNVRARDDVRARYNVRAHVRCRSVRW